MGVQHLELPPLDAGSASEEVEHAGTLTFLYTTCSLPGSGCSCPDARG